MSEEIRGGDEGLSPRRQEAARGERGPIVPKSANQALHPERAPQPPKRSRRARSQVIVFLNFVMSLVVLVVLGAVATVYFGKMAFEAPGPLEQSTTFFVREGSGLARIAADLEERGIITDARVFRAGVSAYDKARSLKAGEYAIEAHASMRNIMNLFESGKSILHSITFAEGLTVKQIFDKLAANRILEGDLPKEMPPEGSLLPETYKFTRGTTRAEIIAQMKAAQDRVVDEIWARRDPDLPLETKEELITLASIVEEETGRADERSRVAAVFLNRLEEGMRLQSDPTIIYGIWGGAGKPPGEPIRQSHIESNNPYNTYIIDGLPPTPISNPGRAALEAVANPSETDDLYFVADGTGGHAFAATLEEHNANVRRWREIEAERQRQFEAETEEAAPAGFD